MIKIEFNGKDLNHECFKFSGGEVHVKLKKPYPKIESQNIVAFGAFIKNSDDFFELALLKNAVDNLLKASASPDKRLQTTTILNLKYTPYSRQDRVTSPVEPFSLKVFSDMINTLNFHEVTLSDPHSDVTPALIKNSFVIDQLNYVMKNSARLGFNHHEPKDVVFIAPDAGAEKKTLKASQYLGVPYLVAGKNRNCLTGEITNTYLNAKPEDLKGKHLVVLDDICDGGRTFIELAKVIKEIEPDNSLNLFVTNGIFSKGKDCLLEAGFERVVAEYDWTI